MAKFKVNKFKMLMYSIYCLIKTDYPRLFNDIAYIKSITNRKTISIYTDMIKSLFVKGISFSDYCYLKFYEKNMSERQEYIGTAEIYEFQKKMNHSDFVKYLNNKNLFNLKFHEYTKRESLDINKCSIEELEQWLIDKKHIIVKPSEGTIGVGIEKISISDFGDANTIFKYLKNKRLDLVEELIIQNQSMCKLNPNSVNTIRVMTVLDRHNNVNFIGAALRMSTGKVVDNFNAGGIAAPIELKTGKVFGPAVSKSIQDAKTYYEHPLSNERISGFTIPRWDEVLEIIESACRVIPEVRTVGWDVAITENGVLLVEGNHNWCKNFFQQVYGEGKRTLILDYYDK